LSGVSNGPEARATREEEVAFLIIEAVLGVDIRLADAGGGNKTPDGAWVYPGANARPAIVEVTSPPDTKLMRTWAEAKRAGTSQSESGSAPARWNELAEVCMEILREPWALENIEKLTSHPAEERHLFLFGRSYRVENYFYRLSDTYEENTTEHVADLVLPDGVTDVWFRGRARRGQDSDVAEIRVARFNKGTGWQRHLVEIHERALPAPNPGIVDDKVLPGWRKPKVRTEPIRSRT